MPSYTAESLVEYSDERLKTLHDNALRNASMKGALEIIALCEAEIARRKPPKVARTISGVAGRGRPVLGFHFVCPQEKDVDPKSDGTFWTGTWVVGEGHAEHGVKISAYVALHTSKADLSYRQGTIKAWRRRERKPSYTDGQEVKTRHGVDFLIESTDEPLRWRGDGAGEKGYFYGDEEP